MKGLKKGKKLKALDVSALFHTMLFAHQKRQDEYLGSGALLLVRPILQTIDHIHKDADINLLEGNNVEEVLDNFAKMIVETEVVEKAGVQKIREDKYVFKIDGCQYAEHVHHLLDPKDVTCPFALIAMTLYQKSTGEIVKLNYSKLDEEGAETVIESSLIERILRPEAIAKPKRRRKKR